MRFDMNAGSAKRRLALSSSTAVLAMLISAPAFAQQAAQGTESITVSSSRIMSSGFTAPTPTTVINADELTKQANTNVFTTVTQLPSLMGSTGSSVGNGGSSNGVNGLSALNLRGLGTQRNLIMIDGERVIPTSTQGVVDISQFPSMLLQRVDVVTGGASASFGSDAVSGIVNFVLDKKFEGFKLNLNGGITNYADDPQAQLQFAAGTGFLGGRAHIEVSGEFTSEAGVNSVVGPRRWYQNPQQLQMFSAGQCQPSGCPTSNGNTVTNGTMPAGGPMWFNVLNGKFTQFSYGGLITRGPLMGTQFGANGTPSPFDYGFGANGLPATPQRNAGNANVNNCSSGGYCQGGDLAGNQTGYASMVARLVRGNAYMRLSYDLTDHISIYGSAIYSEVVTWDKPTQSFFKSDNLHIGCDNPYLPASVAQACLSNNGQTAAYNSQFTSIPGAGGFGVGGIVGPGGYAPVANVEAGITNPSPLTLGAIGAAGSPVQNGFINGFTAGQMNYGVQNSVLQNVENYNNRTMRRFVLGAEGDFNLFDIDWTFKLYGQHGEVNYHNTLENILVTPFYDAAIDAVQVTAGNQASFPGVPQGSVVCRSVAARSVGCVPLNIIGTTGASPAARSFVQGINQDGSNPGANGRFPWAITDTRQEVLDYGMSGDVFENWAGKVSVATGFQYREEALTTRTDCASRGNCANEVFGGTLYGPAGNPLLNPASVNVNGQTFPGFPNWYAGNFQPARGVFHEWETFLETNIPLLDTPEWGRINANLAGRYTHYTTSGDVETWKVAAVWDTPLDGLRLRALQSRDVRAPNLAELFGGARVNNGSVTDDFNLNGGAPNQSISPLPNPIVANPALKPEKGQTTELGLVWSPSYIPGLNLSATYWRVGIKGQIVNLGQQDGMNLCFGTNGTNGDPVQCSYFFTPVNGVNTPWAANGVINVALTTTRPTVQISPFLNLAQVVTDGFDYEASYRFAMDDAIDWGMGGDMTIRLLATNVSKFITNPGIKGAAIAESAGTNAGNVPHWKIFFNQGYDTDNWGLFVNERWFSEGVVSRLWVACTSACPAPVDANHPTVSSNYMPGELYFDIGGHFDLSAHAQLYFKVDNVTNQNPGNAYSFGPSNQSPSLNPALYDVLGRFYHIGFRINN
ncbi:MAG TPA: TonB-dependent receptor [Rhizomicrobium sp.]|jgi:iron complex outermembrane receptor protein|nr:TonB-dependent receptor [Rhizomicrobium sp.]